MSDKIEEIAIVGILTTATGDKQPCARLINKIPFMFSAPQGAAACITLFEAFLNAVDEQKQNEFESQFITLFQAMFEGRHDYMEIIKD